MDSTAPTLSLDRIGRRYGPVTALEDISFDLHAGEILCLLGASGCGKSTLLRLIAGLEAPDSGRILMDGQVLAGPGLSADPETRGIGLMFQDYALFPHLTVAENVSFGLRGWPRAKADARVREMLELVGAGALAGRYAHMLSGGESQRVALARALAPRPGLLLMDEPFSNLDQGLRETVRSETLSLLRDMGIGAIIVTHDPHEALAVADRLVLMRAGRVEAVGTPRELYHNPPTAYCARFLGPGMSLQGVVRDGVLGTPLGRFPAPDLGEGQRAIAFFRPQALTLCDPAHGAVARVLRHDFMGAHDRLWLSLEADGTAVQVDLPACPVPGTEAQPGTLVGLRIDPALVRVFADGDKPE